MLIAHKANVDRPYKNGLTPLNKAIFYKHTEAEKLLRAAGAKETPLPSNFVKGSTSENAGKLAQAKSKDQTIEDNYKRNKSKLDGLKAQMARKANEIYAVENEMSAIGWSGPSAAPRGVTGYQCDVNNQNCRATYQGGGESGSSYWRRSENMQRQRDLERKRNILILEYDSLANKYNKILEGK